MSGFLNKSIVRRFNVVILSVITLGLISFALLISYNNYNRTIQELNEKAKGTIELARIAIQEPLYNYDDVGMESILTAIMLDADIMALQVLDEKNEPRYNRQIERLAERSFDQIKQLPNVLYNAGDISKDELFIGRVEIVSSTKKAEELIRQTSILIGAFALILLVLMASIVALVATRVIKVPIVRLEESAAALAQGNLEQEIDTSRGDELGSLARSFANMRDAIRKKMADLKVLNVTGEKLAGMHKQTEALESALSVMQRQFNVEWGSIYLLEEDEHLSISAFYPERVDAQGHVPRAFRLGEGIAGTTAAAREITFIPDTSKAEGFVDNEAGEGRALLCIPMMDDQDVFGVMNFSGQVGEVTYSEEDAEFALTVARMTVVTTKNIQMLNVIEEQNRTLEQKVQERTAELRQKTNDINNMLQNMHQGIFTIIEENRVHPEYSAFVESILEEQDIAGRDALELLFSSSNLGSDAMNSLTEAMAAMIGEDAMSYEFNVHHLISEYQKIMPDGRTKIIEVDWDPIVNEEDDIIEKIMVTLRDVTELRGLQAEAEKQKQELEIIGQILSVSQSKFQDFLHNAKLYIRENEQLIRDTNEKDQDTLATLFRNMHTIKGNARTYGFKYLTDVVHETEQTYDKLRKDAEAQWDKKRLLDELYETEEHLKQYETVFRNKLGGGQDREGSFIEKSLLDAIKAAVQTADSLAPEQLRQSVHKVNTLISAVGSEPIGDAIEGILKAVPSLAEELGKPAPQVAIHDNGVRFLPEVGGVLKDVFMHVFRNSLDHGLESPDVREAAGKPPAGSIELVVQASDDAVHCVFADDGRGLNKARIVAKAVESGVLDASATPSDSDVAALIFHSGLSTADQVTKVSGRGVGMDAVREFLRKKGGDIRIVLRDDVAAQPGFLPFKLDIELPRDCAVVIVD